MLDSDGCNSKNNQLKPKFTGSYKKKRVHYKNIHSTARYGRKCLFQTLGIFMFCQWHLNFEAV